MKKIKLYIATSLNGKIADKVGGVDWLESIPKPKEGDYGYSDFMNSVDTTIQGYNTYKQVIDWGIDFPYAGMKNYVLTRDCNRKNTEFVEFVSENHISFIEDIKQGEGQDIWLIGGGQINTLLFNANLIDKIIVFVMPIVLSEGIDMLEGLPITKPLKLIESIKYDTGAVEMRYEIS